jgi:hypothetical protein
MNLSCNGFQLEAQSCSLDLTRRPSPLDVRDKNETIPFVVNVDQPVSTLARPGSHVGRCIDVNGDYLSIVVATPLWVGFALLTSMIAGCALIRQTKTAACPCSATTVLII